MEKMLFEIEPTVRRKARSPHELFMFNLAVFHLMLAPISIFIMKDVTALFIPLLFSGAVFSYIFFRGKRAEKSDHWFVMAHWKFAFRRARLLMIGYAASAVIITGGWLLAQGADTNMQEIILTVSSRIGIMPTFVLVVVTFVLESGSIYQAGRGEVPDGLLKKYPAPADIAVKPEAAEPQPTVN
jgi:hypothetical protein